METVPGRRLRELVRAVPWLANLPEDVLRDLDVGELAVPTGAVAHVRRMLERVLGCRVMTYRVPAPPPAGRELCESLPPAVLRRWQRALVQAAELLVGRGAVLFCVYRRPAR